MTEWLESIDVLPIAVTLAAFWVGQRCQKKWKSPLLNPILIGGVLVIGFLLLTGISPAIYRAGTGKLSWLMTPATVSLAIPMYEQLQVLKKNHRAILVGAASGAVSSMGMLLVAGLVLKLDPALVLGLMPKSVTTAIGVPLSELYGGISSVTTAAIIITGVIANTLGSYFCRWFKITDPVARGVAMGTAGHMIATAKAEEWGPLEGAVSSVSLVTAGLLTAVVFPLLAGFVT